MNLDKEAIAALQEMVDYGHVSLDSKLIVHDEEHWEIASDEGEPIWEILDRLYIGEAGEGS